ncbi:hypothetical protein FHX42_004358 [Saccharopolyspora lacisalsi]|uniref:Uncharacterized protein n=1 Tax=Halosaccharopolyspora lacisalsi TaxID=1000566 RepID=A0A839DZP0_9PSEU|nr:hypothetical protein [Halosaccharopolyspora lacisalsi]
MDLRVCVAGLRCSGDVSIGARALGSCCARWIDYYSSGFECCPLRGYALLDNIYFCRSCGHTRDGFFAAGESGAAEDAAGGDEVRAAGAAADGVSAPATASVDAAADAATAAPATPAGLRVPAAAVPPSSSGSGDRPGDSRSGLGQRPGGVVGVDGAEPETSPVSRASPRLSPDRVRRKNVVSGALAKRWLWILVPDPLPGPRRHDAAPQWRRIGMTRALWPLWNSYDGRVP